MGASPQGVPGWLAVGPSSTHRGRQMSLGQRAAQMRAGGRADRKILVILCSVCDVGDERQKRSKRCTSAEMDDLAQHTMSTCQNFTIAKRNGCAAQRCNKAQTLIPSPPPSCRAVSKDAVCMPPLCIHQCILNGSRQPPLIHCLHAAIRLAAVPCLAAASVNAGLGGSAAAFELQCF